MKNRFLSILLCLMTLIGCQNKSSFSEIFFNSECGLPCWNNLIPGQSIEDGFQDWIDKSPFIDGSTISKISDRGFFDAIYIINFKDIKVGSNLYYKDHKLYALWISGKLNISLKNLIKEIGEPESVVIVHIMRGGDVIVDEVNVVFQNKGLIATYRNTANGQATVNENVRIQQLILADQINLLDCFDYIIAPDSISRITYDWKGYGYYPTK